MKRFCLLGLSLALFCAIAGASDPASPPGPAALANDNRTPAGELKDGVLTVQLELVRATWYPEQEGGKSFAVYGFAEKGKMPQIPGPLLRVPQGTAVILDVHNTLPRQMFLRGFRTPEPVPVAPGDTARVRFTAGTAGTYYYSARSCATSIHDIGFLELAADLPMGEDPFEVESTLSGALVVDAPGAPTDDRILVITNWMSGVVTPPFREVLAVNGKSWPYSERLSYRQGEPARFRMINSSLSDHAMHLHGFFFEVNSEGGQDQEQAYPPGQAAHAVTEWLGPGATASITWTPDRVGRWLLHCHMTGHMAPNGVVLVGQPDPHAAHAMPGDSAGMMGLVMGITVTPGTQSAAAQPSAAKVRQLNLFVRESPATEFLPVSMGYLVQEAGAAAPPPSAPLRAPGPPIVLTRGEPAEITITNELKHPTVVHWHGIELQSYYDGVAGFGGDSSQMTPSIPPGGTFVARMTPPRAGTFIYHTHWHDVEQLTAGLYGPLIVLEPGQKFDPATDKIFVIGRQNPDEASNSLLVLNGQPQPAETSLKGGTKYRLRFINIGTNDADLQFSLRQSDGQLAQWRPLAKDGWALPTALAIGRPAFQPITVGETYDFEFQPEKAGELILQVRARFSKIGLTQVILVN